MKDSLFSIENMKPFFFVNKYILSIKNYNQNLSSQHLYIVPIKDLKIKKFKIKIIKHFIYLYYMKKLLYKYK